MKIKELEQLLKVPRATIRFYERQGLINPLRDEINDYREYSDEDVIRLKKILILRKLGFTISDIADLIDGTVELSEIIDAQIESLIEHKTQLEGAISVCQEMKLNSVSINTLDGDRYRHRKAGRSRLSLVIRLIPFQCHLTFVRGSFY